MGLGPPLPRFPCIKFPLIHLSCCSLPTGPLQHRPLASLGWVLSPESSMQTNQSLCSQGALLPFSLGNPTSTVTALGATFRVNLIARKNKRKQQSKTKPQTLLPPSFVSLSGDSNVSVECVASSQRSQLHFLTPFCPFELPQMHYSLVYKNIFPFSKLFHTSSTPSPIPFPRLTIHICLFLWYWLKLSYRFPDMISCWLKPFFSPLRVYAKVVETCLCLTKMFLLSSKNTNKQNKNALCIHSFIPMRWNSLELFVFMSVTLFHINRTRLWGKELKDHSKIYKEDGGLERGLSG